MMIFQPNFQQTFGSQQFWVNDFYCFWFAVYSQIHLRTNHSWDRKRMRLPVHKFQLTFFLFEMFVQKSKQRKRSKSKGEKFLQINYGKERFVLKSVFSITWPQLQKFPSQINIWTTVFCQCRFTLNFKTGFGGQSSKKRYTFYKRRLNRFDKI